MRRIRGEIDVRPTFCKEPSQVLEDTVHIFLKKLKLPVDLLSTVGEEFGQDLRASEPEDLLPGSGRKKSSLKCKSVSSVRDDVDPAGRSSNFLMKDLTLIKELSLSILEIAEISNGTTPTAA